MNATRLFAVTVLTAVAGTAFADDTGGILITRGEASGHYAVPPKTVPSTLSRESVKASVLRARSEGTLIPAGGALWGSAMYNTPRSTLARADVKAQVQQARLDGTLMPAGEAYGVADRSFGVAPVVLTQARVSR